MAGRDRNEQILLKRVTREVCDRRQQSLHHRILLPLADGDVACPPLLPQGYSLHRTDGNLVTDWAGGAIGHLFAQPDINGRLMITGPAGIGKTTALLALAAEQLQRVSDDPQAPIPVLFHLSSWCVEQQSFEDWLQTELTVKYGVSPTLSRQWWQSQNVYPLLDGLDTLSTQHQETAIQHLNAWLADHPHPVVVSCRRASGDRTPSPLALNGILALQPLTNAQLETGLIALHLDSLWRQLQTYPEWLELVRIPLWLNLCIALRDSLDFADWQRSHNHSNLRDYVLNSFIGQQLHTPLENAATPAPLLPTAQQTRHWLGWLAQYLHQQSKHEFLIEDLQPTLLKSHQHIILYRLLGGVFLGGISGLVFGLFIGLGSGFLAALVVAILFLLRRGKDAITPMDSKPTMTSLMQFIIVRQLNPLLLFFVLGVGVSIFYADGISNFVFILSLLLLVGFILRLIIALPSWLVGGFVFKFNHFLEADVQAQAEPNSGIQETLRYVLRIGAMFIPLLVLLKILPLFWFGQQLGLNFLEATKVLKLAGIIAAIALWASIFDSAMICAQHLALRLVLFRAKVIPWNYTQFLDICCDRALLQRVEGRYQFIHHLVQEKFMTI